MIFRRLIYGFFLAGFSIAGSALAQHQIEPQLPDQPQWELERLPPPSKLWDGQTAFFTSDRNGHFNILGPVRDMGKRWNLIIPGNFNGDRYTDLLFYNPYGGSIYHYDHNQERVVFTQKGRGLFMTIEEGKMKSLADHKAWGQEWDLIVPGNFGGDSHTDLLFYSASEGLGVFYTTDGSGNIEPLRTHHGWGKDWDLIIPGNFGGDGYTDLLFYSASEGRGVFYTTDGFGNIVTLKDHRYWGARNRKILAGRFDNDAYTDLAVCDQSGFISFYTSRGNGDLGYKNRVSNPGGNCAFTGYFKDEPFSRVFVRLKNGDAVLVSSDGRTHEAPSQFVNWKNGESIVAGQFGRDRNTDVIMYQRAVLH